MRWMWETTTSRIGNHAWLMPSLALRDNKTYTSKYIIHTPRRPYEPSRFISSVRLPDTWALVQYSNQSWFFFVRSALKFISSKIRKETILRAIEASSNSCWVHPVCVLCVCCLPVYSGRQACGRTSRGHTGFPIHLPFAVLAIIFLARRVQPFLSLVNREVEFLCTNELSEGFEVTKWTSRVPVETKQTLVVDKYTK